MSISHSISSVSFLGIIPSLKRNILQKNALPSVGATRFMYLKLLFLLFCVFTEILHAANFALRASRGANCSAVKYKPMAEII